MCAYIERLVEKGLSPGTIRNHISAITTHMKLRGWSTHSLRSLKVSNALRAVERNVRHVPRQRSPVSPQLLRRVVMDIGQRDNGPMMCLAIIIMFQAFLRQSNLLPRSVKAFDPTRQLTMSDIKLRPASMDIKVKWSKTQQTFGDTRVTTLHAIPGSSLCPLKSFKAAQHRRGRCRPSAPLIAFPDGNPITLAYLKRAWDDAVSSLGLLPAKYSLHSLRKGGASHCYYKGGAPIHQVMTHGGWKSESVRAYLRPPHSHKTSVHKALLQL